MKMDRFWNHNITLSAKRGIVGGTAAQQEWKAHWPQTECSLSALLTATTSLLPDAELHLYFDEAESPVFDIICYDERNRKTFYLDEIYIRTRHGLASIDEAEAILQGQGYGSRAMFIALDLCHLFGAKQVECTAGRSNGPSTWHKMGWLPNPERRLRMPDMGDNVAKNLKAKDYPADQIESIKAQAATINSNPYAIWQLGDAPYGHDALDGAREFPIIFDFTDPRQCQRADDYFTRKIGFPLFSGQSIRSVA
jgi:hypothetical protein